jgi:hypothetical protein
VKHDNRANDGGGGTCDGAEVRADFEAGEKSEKDDDGKCGDESREPPVAKGVVHLIPSHESLRKVAAGTGGIASDGILRLRGEVKLIVFG